MAKVLVPANGHSRPDTLGAAEGTLMSFSVPCADIAPDHFLHKFSGTARVYLESESAESTFAGAGSLAVLTARGPGRFDAIRQQARRLFEGLVVSGDPSPPAVIGPRLFGGFAFGPSSEPDDAWQGFGAATFILPEYQLLQVDGNAWLTLNRLLAPGEDVEEATREMRRAVLAMQSRVEAPLADANHASHHGQIQASNLMSRRHWNQIVGDAITRIRAGELDKVVLAQAQAVEAARPIDPLTILRGLKAQYPACYAFLMEPLPGYAFFGATPELLVAIRASRLNAMALAGSIRRGASEAEDDALGREMMANPKERHEHALVVQTIEDSLRTLTAELTVASQPSLFKLRNVQHLRTDVRGLLRDGEDILGVVEALHPTPAVGGLPRKVALQLVTEAEPIPRGWYASPVGWIDHQENGRFVVGIRSAVSTGRQARLYAGAGIVADSVPEAEWDETQLKFQPLLNALQGSVHLEFSQP